MGAHWKPSSLFESLRPAERPSEDWARAQTPPWAPTFCQSLARAVPAYAYGAWVGQASDRVPVHQPLQIFCLTSSSLCVQSMGRTSIRKQPCECSPKGESFSLERQSTREILGAARRMRRV